MQTCRRRLRRSVREEVFREYCTNSSIHGVRYFDRDERTTCERFWWIVVFLLSMFGCDVMIYKTYVKWNQTPIIVTFSEKTTPVWDIHFPAITICPETKKHSDELNFTAEMSALFYDYLAGASHRKSITQLKEISHLCNSLFHPNNDFLKNYTDTEDDVVGVLKNLSPLRHGTLGFCQYNQYKLCDDQMKETLTEEDKKSYFPDNKLLTPLYARGAGLHAGLSLFLTQMKKDVDYMCTGFSHT